MSRTENAELTVLCLLRDGGRILLQNRLKRDWRGYTLPGGNVERGESFVGAVVHEMREETGLTVIEPRLVGVKQFPIEGGRYIVFLFASDKFEGELRSSDEGEMEWVERSRLAEINAVEDLAELLRVMESPELTEFQYLVSGDEWTVNIR